MNNLSTVVICVCLVLICICAVKSYLKKVNSGCCGGGDGTIKIKPKDTNKNNYAHKFDVFINGMTCAHCALRIENAFNDTEKYYASVKLNDKKAIVYSKIPFNEDEIKSIVEKAGYEYVKTGGIK